MQATSLLQLSAVAQQVELTVRMTWQNQWQGLPQVTISLLLQQAVLQSTGQIATRFCLQVQRSLQEQLRRLLQQLFQLASALQAFAEDNKAHSQQLRFQHGISSKVFSSLEFLQSSRCLRKSSIDYLCCLQVAEKLMLAHCEQELAQRAKIVSETMATVQLPPFAQVFC